MAQDLTAEQGKGREGEKQDQREGGEEAPGRPNTSQVAPGGAQSPQKPGGSHWSSSRKRGSERSRN